MTRSRGAFAAAALLLTSACGVSTQDSPRIVDDTSSQSPEPTPSIDTAPPSTTTATSSTPAPT